MTTATTIADALRPLAPGGKLDAADVPLIDKLAFQWDARKGGKVIGQAADVAATDIPDDYWPMLSKIESGDRPYIKAGTSSASGLYQFIRASWIAEGGKWGSDMSQAFGGLKPSPEEQLQRAKTFTAKNADILKAKGIPINKASLYAAHFFGAGMAAKVIGADVSDRADLIAGSAATEANPSILRGKTVGQFLNWLHGKTGDWAR